MNLILKSKWSPSAFYTRKNKESSGVGGSDIIWMVQSKWKQAAFFTRKHKESGGVGESDKNLQSKWGPSAFYTRKHKESSGVEGSGIWICTVKMKPKRILCGRHDFSFVGGGLKRGMYIHEEQRLGWAHARCLVLCHLFWVATEIMVGCGWDDNVPWLGQIKANIRRCGMLGKRSSSKYKQIQILAAAALHRKPGTMSVLDALQLCTNDCSKGTTKIALKDTFVPNSLTWLEWLP